MSNATFRDINHYGKKTGNKPDPADYLERRCFISGEITPLIPTEND
jgi:hypothetical protein